MRIMCVKGLEKYTEVQVDSANLYKPRLAVRIRLDIVLVQ